MMMDLPHVSARPGVPMISQPDLRWKRCDIKSTNLLANVLAIEAAHRRGAFEAVLVDAQGYVTEATHTSLLWVRGGCLEGTPEGHEILPGMTRQLVLKLVGSLDIPFRGTHVTLKELKAADELILVGNDNRGRRCDRARRNADRRQASLGRSRCGSIGLTRRPSASWLAGRFSALIPRPAPVLGG